MPRTGRPKLASGGKSVGMSFRMTARQYELLGALAKLFTADAREVSPFAPEVTAADALRMCIMMTAYSRDLIELNHEPQSSFDLPAQIRKGKKKPKK